VSDLGTVQSVVLGALLGAFGVLGAVLYAVATHPEQVKLWASWIWRALTYLWKGAEYRYIASDVEGHINLELKRIESLLDGISARKVSIRWTNSAQAVAEEKAGTLIVRMRQHEHRLSNVLHASLVAMPRLVAPTTRQELGTALSRSIDLQLCRQLARRMGSSAETVYRLEILNVALREEPALAKVLADLNRLELGGLFVPVFLQELVKIGATHTAEPTPGLAKEAEHFVAFLKRIAEREHGASVELTHVGRWFRVNVLLVAKSERAREGIHPFVWRVGRELAEGADTIYVMATKRNEAFARTVVEALDADRRLIKQRERLLKIERAGTETRALLVPFERNLGYELGDHLDELLRAGALVVGADYDAVVTDVRRSYALVDLEGLQAVARARDCGWHFVTDCRDELEIGDSVRVQVLAVRPDHGDVAVSVQKCLPNPLEEVEPSELMGSVSSFKVIAKRRRAGGPDSYLVGTLQHRDAILPAILQDKEVEWGAPPELIRRFGVDDEIDVVVSRIDKANGRVFVSRKRLAGDKWERLRDVYPKGTKLEVSATIVEQRGVFCDVEAGVVGFVPASEFKRAGLEYADFERNVRTGDKLYVVVQRVVGGQKRRITLGLQRLAG
jgi:predicted RNA-binding protein with RPS1 domain